jgi:hypothetical protein
MRIYGSVIPIYFTYLLYFGWKIRELHRLLYEKKTNFQQILSLIFNRFHQNMSSLDCYFILGFLAFQNWRGAMPKRGAEYSIEKRLYVLVHE